MKRVSPLKDGGKKETLTVRIELKSIFLRIFLLPGIVASFWREGRMLLGLWICVDGTKDGVDLRLLSELEEGEGSFNEGRGDWTDNFLSSSDESDMSIRTSRPGSILIVGNSGTTVDIVEELQGIRSTVEAFMIDSVKPYRRYLPGRSLHIVALLSKVTGSTMTEYCTM